MPSEETIEVTHSESGGNGLPTETPSATPDPVTPPVEGPAKPAEPEVKLFELPDGRKVDADTLTKEWKENFLPDYTRKSQELASVKTHATQSPLPTQTANPYADPDYIPQSYEEVIRAAEERALQKIEQRESQRIAEQKALEDTVVSQLESVKKIDPGVDENALFLHATKYGFRDLTVAHKNMKDMSEMIKKVQTTTAQNIAKRSDPVSSSPGATGARPNPADFSTARDYLRSLN